MSVFICDERMLQAMVGHVRDHIMDRAFYAGQEYSNGDLLVMLYNENIRSWNARYRDNMPEVEEIEFRPDQAEDITGIQFIKYLHCYAYQACEHDGWKDCLGRRLVKRWEQQAIQNLPGYEAAMWGIPKPYGE